ncbi:MAG: 4-hydroxybenzoate octaprenyltransferase [Acidiferrobacterales bacterium]|nr:4-hydroxybenzoate octaprenyltransferase [Acidiferrobacterales bacterium]
MPTSSFTDTRFWKSVFPYIRLVRMDRPVGTLLLLWPTLCALWLATGGNPNPNIVLIFVAGTFVMRSAGCAINDFADRKVDLHVERTKDRPIPSGQISPKMAIVTFFGLLLVALGLVLMLNKATIQLSLFGALVAAAYPFFKRITNLPQLVLGVAFSWGIPMAYSAHLGYVPAAAWLLFLANFVWIVAYDTQYAMADREDDLRIGVKSTAILFGEHDNRIVGGLHFTALLLFAWLGLMYQLGWHYYLCLFAAGGFAIYQQWLCRDYDRKNCFLAFKNNIWFGAMIFAGVLLGQAGAA